uniref:Uncharacterized protein n=1 Tax=Arundo donax TaxID=35708 RepID=A0A0A9DMC4_ARUDO
MFVLCLMSNALKMHSLGSSRKWLLESNGKLKSSLQD